MALRKRAYYERTTINAGVRRYMKFKIKPFTLVIAFRTENGVFNCDSTEADLPWPSSDEYLLSIYVSAITKVHGPVSWISISIFKNRNVFGYRKIIRQIFCGPGDIKNIKLLDLDWRYPLPGY